MGDRAGSVTSYFFKHNFCQCHAVAADALDGAARNSAASGSKVNIGTGSGLGAGSVCSNCGKSKGGSNRLGSLTSFLFQDLKCECGGSAVSKSINKFGAHTDTATRAKLRRLSGTVANFDASLNTAIDPGTIIGGVYSVVSLIGVGGMGSVYLVDHPTLNRQFALKVMWAGSVNEENWSRFKAEAQTIASLNHPTFVKVYDLGLHEKRLPYYVMDFLFGRSLEEILIDDGPLSEADAIDVYTELLDGLAYAHRHGIVHRDLKPANIMLCSDDGVNSVKILDFGISKLTDSAPLKAQHLTVAGDIFGSPFYMSPEQCAGEKIDARSDIYSLGCSLFETLTGCVPFDGQGESGEQGNAFVVMTKHQEDEPPHLDDVFENTKFSTAMNMVVAKCLAKLPDHRYQSAKELALDLDRVKDGRDLLNYSPGLYRRTGSHLNDSYDSQPVASGANRWVAALALLLLVAIVGYGVSNFGSSASLFAGKEPTAIDKIEPARAEADSKNSADVVASTKEDTMNIVDDQWIARSEEQIAATARLYGPDHPITVNKLTSFAYGLRNQANYKKAEEVYKRLWDIYLRNLGPDNHYAVTTWNEIADACENQGKFEEAEKYYKMALVKLETDYDKRSPSNKTTATDKNKKDNSELTKDLANQFNLLATLYRIQKKYDLAEPLYKRSIAIDPVGNWSSSSRTARQNYCFLLRDSHRDKEAEQLEKQLAKVTSTYNPPYNEVSKSKSGLNDVESIDAFLR